MQVCKPYELRKTQQKEEIDVISDECQEGTYYYVF